jgi:hypothetical protein
MRPSDVRSISDGRQVKGLEKMCGALRKVEYSVAVDARSHETDTD